MAIRNSIYIGFAWTQGFIVPLEIVSVDAGLRIDWKNDRDGAVLVRSMIGQGITRDADEPTQYIVRFEKEQTVLLTAGRLTGEFVVEHLDGSESVVGSQVIVPVSKSGAEPTP